MLVGHLALGCHLAVGPALDVGHLALGCHLLAVGPALDVRASGGGTSAFLYKLRAVAIGSPLCKLHPKTVVVLLLRS